MNKVEAKKKATEIVESLEMDNQYAFSDTEMVGLDADGYWIADAEGKVTELDKEKAVETITTKLTEAKA